MRSLPLATPSSSSNVSLVIQHKMLSEQLSMFRAPTWKILTREISQFCWTLIRTHESHLQELSTCVLIGCEHTQFGFQGS